MLWQCIDALRGLAGLNAEVSPEDACHAALHRFDYEPHRLYADERRRPIMGELLQAYAGSPGPCERLFAICESGDAFAFLGNQASAWTGSASTTLTALVQAGTLDLDVPVRFLESVAILAFALADAYNIEVLPVGWPYWNLSFPGEMTDGGPGSGATLVCGEHELLSVINDRVRQHQQADESTGTDRSTVMRAPGYFFGLGFAGDRHEDPSPPVIGSSEHGGSFDAGSTDRPQDRRVVDLEILGHAELLANRSLLIGANEAQLMTPLLWGSHSRLLPVAFGFPRVRYQGAVHEGFASYCFAFGRRPSNKPVHEGNYSQYHCGQPEWP